MKHCLESRGVFSFSKVGKALPAAVKAKKTLKSDLDIINEPPVLAVGVGSTVAEVDNYLDNRKKTEAKAKKATTKKVASSTVS